jgi:hypothetical protein
MRLSLISTRSGCSATGSWPATSRICATPEKGEGCGSVRLVRELFADRPRVRAGKVNLPVLVRSRRVLCEGHRRQNVPVQHFWGRGTAWADCLGDPKSWPKSTGTFCKALCQLRLRSCYSQLCSNHCGMVCSLVESLLVFDFRYCR